MSNTSKERVIKSLSEVLASSYTLLLKLHNYHWNVTGVHFKMLHELFEEQYTELFGAIDEVAERIRALDAMAPGSFSEFQKLSKIKEPSDVPSSESMIKQLADDHATLSKLCLETAEIASSVGDEGSMDLMVSRSQVHDKARWMLNATAC